jgi:hypothetical protein
VFRLALGGVAWLGRTRQGNQKVQGDKMSIGKVKVQDFCEKHNACVDVKEWAIKAGAENMDDDTPPANTYPDDKVLALVEAAKKVRCQGHCPDCDLDAAFAALEASRGEQAATVDRKLFDRAMSAMEAMVGPLSKDENKRNRMASEVLKQVISALRAQADKGGN